MTVIRSKIQKFKSESIPRIQKCHKSLFMNLHDYLQTLELLIKYPASYDEMRSSSLKMSN